MPLETAVGGHIASAWPLIRYSQQAEQAAAMSRLAPQYACSWKVSNPHVLRQVPHRCALSALRPNGCLLQLSCSRSLIAAAGPPYSR